MERVRLAVMESTATIKVKGMTCDGCTASLTRAFQATRGVKRADVSLEKKLATVVYNNDEVNERQLRDVVQRVGFTAGD